ncbi:oligosaccharide flippase family protein, partial [Nocardioides massiliensis]
RASRVVAAVPAIAPWVPETVAAGTTDGLRWVATRWVPAVAPRTHRRLAATTLPTVARTLAETTTGRTAPGWSLTWLAAVDLLDARTRHRLVPLLERLDDGVPTGWCHGDPWPGNVLPASPHPVVTDWDNAVADAPQGIDQLLVAAFERATTHRVDLATACHDLLELPLEARVAGREWTSWSPVERAALVVAAAVLHLRNRSVVDLDAERLEAYRETLRAIADTALPPSGSIPARAGTLGGAGWLGIGAGVVKAAQTIVLLVLAALLEPSAIGVIAIGALVLNVTSAVTDLGTATALVHWRGDAERAARSALAVAGGLALGLTAITWAAAPWMSEVLNGGDLGVTIIRGLMLCLPMYAVAAISQELLRRDLAFKRRVVPDVVGAVVGALVSIGLAYAGAGAISLVIGQLVQAFLVMALCWVVRPPVLPGWVPTDVRALLAYGFHLAGAAVLQLLMLNVDYLMVANRLGAEQLGIYSMAFRLGYMPYLLVGVVIAGAAFAHLCRIRGPELGRAVGETMLRTLAIVVPLYVGMILLAPQLTLLGTQWEPGVPALRWLAAYGIVLSVLGLAIVALNAAGHTRDGFWLTLLHLVLLAGLLQVWVDRGVEMVAVAQLVAGAASLVVAAIALQRRIAGLQWWTMARRSLPILVGVAGMVAVELGLAQLLPWARVSYVGLLIIGSATLLAYLVPLLSLDRHRLLPVPTIRGRRR